MKRSILIIILLLTASMSANSQQALKPKFSHPEIIRYDHDAFIINNRDTFVFSGCFHYFRCDPSEWMDRLKKIKAAGFNTIETYVPWNFHEQVEGKADFSQLTRYLDSCQHMGFYVILRVGPYVCGEWDFGGFPRWLGGKNIGLRTASAQDISWSRYWYDELLPVVRPYLITQDGPIILLQIENEYNYGSASDTQKVQYLKSLYRDAIRNRIDVPIITCLTKQVRDKTDSVFSQIMDAVNFYPGWNFQAPLPRVELMKKEEPFSPPFVTEFQGGWFTPIGDSTVRLVNKYSAAQIDGLTKFMIAHGIKGLSYYMLYGGTNFDYWAGRGKITSYDYTAPISEPGGLWSKYYAVKLIGDFLKYSQPYLSRCDSVEGGAVCADTSIESILRSDGKVGFLFVVNKKGQSKTPEVEITMPSQSPFRISVSVDSLGAVALPVDLPIHGGGILHYSTVQISAITKHNDSPLLVAYGTLGTQAVLNFGSWMFSKQVEDHDRLYRSHGCYFLLTSPHRAAHGITLETRKGPAVLLSDSYFISEEKMYADSLEVQTRPGADGFSLVTDGRVKRILVDGKPVASSKHSGSEPIEFWINSPEFQTPEVTLKPFRWKHDDDAESRTHFKKTPAPQKGTYASLDSLGNHDDGYSIYRGTFHLHGNHILKFGYYDNDWHSVYIDGKPVKGSTGSLFDDWADVHLSDSSHTIRILYENQGRPNSGYMEEAKGLRYANVLSEGQISWMNPWRYFATESAPSDTPQQAGVNFDDSGWKSVTIGNKSDETPNGQKVGSWYRTAITLNTQEASDRPRLRFEGISRSALIYVNGKLAHNFRHHGWDEPFTVPFDSLAIVGSNIVAIYLENPGGKGGIVAPIAFEYGKEESLMLTDFVYHAQLDGALEGWEKPLYDDSAWEVARAKNGTLPDTGIIWYRTTFSMPSIKSWIVPWRLHVESTGDMQIWLNGRVLGRYYVVGPQKDFYMPDAWLNHGKENSLVLVIRPSDKGNVAPQLKEVTISPYAEYIAQKHEIELSR